MPPTPKKNDAPKAEGFRGQRLVVLPAGVRERLRAHPLLRGLLVTDAGVFPHAAAHLIERPGGAPTTLLLLCTAGRGWVRLADGGTLPVRAGSLAWLPSGQAHAYGADAGEPWSVEWVHVTGDEVGAWAELLQLPAGGGVVSLDAETATRIGLGGAWEHLERGYSLANLVAAGTVLRSALSAFGRGLAMPGKPGGRSAMERVAASAEWMKEHLVKPMRLRELATLAGLSVPHYSALFRLHTGFAPIDWLIRLRIQRACQLLDTTDAPVRAVGEQAGFGDAYYFARSFRRVMGVSPRAYRKVKKG
ncbi:AraC family transcriptional regulator [Termitidicoccus mucosus]